MPRLLERRARAGARPPVGRDARRSSSTAAVVGVFALFSRRPRAYSTARPRRSSQRLADYVAVGLAHQRLAETARLAAVERERTANVESSVELLRTISDVLDIRTVFPQVSEIANKVLPHDLLTMMFQDRSGHIVIEVARRRRVPRTDPPRQSRRLPRRRTASSSSTISRRRRCRSSNLPICASALSRPAIARCSTVLTRARDQEMGLGFWSKRPHAFGPRRRAGRAPDRRSRRAGGVARAACRGGAPGRRGAHARRAARVARAVAGRGARVENRPWRASSASRRNGSIR